MSRPLAAWLLTQRIDISWVDNLHHASEDGEGNVVAQKAMGVYEMVEQTISMRNGMGFERERQTLLHENLHAMVAAGGLEVAFREDAEEHIVGVLAPVLLSWMRENPHIVKYLMETQA